MATASAKFDESYVSGFEWAADGGAECTRTGSAQKSLGVTCVRVPDTFGATASPGRSLRPANRLVPRGRGQHGRTGIRSKPDCPQRRSVNPTVR
jgi:hypothetical protein